MVYPPADAVTHPSTNRARRRATSLIETNALPLSQPASCPAIAQSSSSFNPSLDEVNRIRFPGTANTTSVQLRRDGSNSCDGILMSAPVRQPTAICAAISQTAGAPESQIVIGAIGHLASAGARPSSFPAIRSSKLSVGGSAGAVWYFPFVPITSYRSTAERTSAGA